MFDELRKRYPKFGFSLYALEPGRAVTLEVLTDDGELFSFKGDTQETAIRRAFPKDFPEPTPEPTPDVTTSVFD